MVSVECVPEKMEPWILNVVEPLFKVPSANPTTAPTYQLDRVGAFDA